MKAVAEATGSRSIRYLRCDGSFVGRGAFNSGAERGKPERALDFGGNRPGAVALVESDLLDRRAAKTAAGGEE